MRQGFIAKSLININNKARGSWKTAAIPQGGVSL